MKTNAAVLCIRVLLVQLIAISASAVSFTYDAEGNTASKIEAGELTTYHWDAENRLVSIESGERRSEFLYDGLGHRVQIVEKEAGTVIDEKRFIWEGNFIIEERNVQDEPTRQYMSGGERRTAADPNPGNYYYCSDHLGSTTAVLDGSGPVVARYEYTPYGEVTQTSGSLDFSMQYTGHYFHAPSGLNLTHYRAYDPTIGRWLSLDPIAERGGLNLYGYVLNNPANHTDPLGLDTFFGHKSVINPGNGHSFVTVGGNNSNPYQNTSDIQSRSYGFAGTGLFNAPGYVSSPDKWSYTPFLIYYKRYKTTPSIDAELDDWINDNYSINQAGGKNPNYTVFFNDCHDFSDTVERELKSILEREGLPAKPFVSNYKRNKGLSVPRR